MPIILADNSIIENPQFAPMFTPFNTVAGCMAAWRGDFSVDLTGNGHTLTKIGAPNQSVNTVLCNKDNGYITNVPDGINRTLIVVHRLPNTVAPPNQTYSNPLGNLSQLGTSQGVGIGIVQATIAGDNGFQQMSGCVGADKKDTPLFSKAMPAQDKPVTNALKWQWSAFAVDGDNNICAMYIPRQLDDLVVGVNAPGVQLKNRWVTENNGPSMYRIGAWRDPSTPGIASSSVEIAYAAIYNRPLLLSDLRQQYQYDKFYCGQVNIAV